MEEKERYKLKSYLKTLVEIYDTELDIWYMNRQPITELLNEQDKRIKELEEENKQLKIHNEYFKSFNCNSFDEFTDFISTFMLTPYEEQMLIKDLKKQLKQSQKQLAINELEKIFYGLQGINRTTIFDNHNEPVQIMEVCEVLDYVNRQVNKLKGE